MRNQFLLLQLAILPFLVNGQISSENSISGQRRVIGAESKIVIDKRIEFTSHIGFAPYNQAIVDVNPPVFKWPYVPHDQLKTRMDPRNFVLQIQDIL